MKKTQSQEETPFLPESFTQAVQKRFKQFLGIILGFFGGILSLALISYSTLDPSLNVATNKPVSNWLGYAGSYTADIIYQSLGLAGWIFNICIYSWAYRIIVNQALPNWKMRLALSIPIMISLGVGLAIMPEIGYFGYNFGGFMGNNISLMLGKIAFVPNFIWNLSFGVVGFVGSYWLIGLNYTEWQKFAGLNWQFLAKMGWLGQVILYKLHKTRAGNHQKFHEEMTEIEDLLSAKAKYNFKNPLLETKDKLLDLNIEPQAMRQNTARVIENLAEQNSQAQSENQPKPAKIIDTPTEIKKSGNLLNRHQSNLFQTEQSDYIYPSVDILSLPKKSLNQTSNEALSENARLLETTLSDFGVLGVINEVRPGPVVALYELEPAPGTKTNRVIGLADDIARSMSALSVRIATVPGRSVIGIEMPNQYRESVYLRELLESKNYLETKARLPLILGKDIGGGAVIADLATMPHLLIAGTTGSGKSVGMNAMIISLLYRYRPDECKFIMVDPKMLELSVYDNIPHLLSPVVTDPKKAVVALKWAVKEMEDRYRAMARLSVRNIDGYNQKVNEALEAGEKIIKKVQVGFDKESGAAMFEEEEFEPKKFPYIVVVVDEMADLMIVAGKEIEASIQRLAQMARAAGIHIIMATQRPSVDVITGTIKANFPTRISFMVTSKIDSRTILSEQGAEQLLGKGDMLFMAPGGRINRVHGPFVEDKEVELICDHLRAQGTPDYIESVTADAEEFDEMSQFEMEQSGGDAYYQKAVALVAREGKASTSFLQRHLNIGYNKAAKIIEEMEKNQIVGPANHVGKREVLIGNNAA